MSLIVKGGGGKPEEEKTVTAGTSAIEVSPSSGKVMKKVTVNPTPTESKSVTPTTSELTVTPSEGKHLSQVVVGAVEDVTPEVNAQTPVITQILEGLVGKAQGANATADKILEGYSAYVGQELLNGTAKDASTMVDLLAATGFTQMAVDKFTTTSNETIAKQISHSLGVIPRLVIICSKAKDSEFNNTNYIRNVFLVVNPSGYSEGAIDYDSSASYRNITDVPNGNGSYACTASIVCAKPYTTTATYYKAGREYTLITIA